MFVPVQLFQLSLTKHSSSVQKFKNYRQEKFYDIGPRKTLKQRKQRSRILLAGINLNQVKLYKIIKLKILWNENQCVIFMLFMLMKTNYLILFESLHWKFSGSVTFIIVTFLLTILAEKEPKKVGSLPPPSPPIPRSNLSVWPSDDETSLIIYLIIYHWEPFFSFFGNFISFLVSNFESVMVRYWRQTWGGTMHICILQFGGRKRMKTWKGLRCQGFNSTLSPFSFCPRGRWDSNPRPWERELLFLLNFYLNFFPRTFKRT